MWQFFEKLQFTAAKLNKFWVDIIYTIFLSTQKHNKREVNVNGTATASNIGYYIYTYILSHVLYLSLFLIACNERAVVDKTVDIDGSIQMEFITAGRFIYIII